MKPQKEKQIKLVLVNFWQFPIETPHFGLICLAAYIRRNFPQIKIRIIEGLNPEKTIIRSKPDLVGFTSDTLVYRKTIAKAKKVRKELTVPFVIGGIHISALPESLDPIFQIGVLGEGELTVGELLKLLIKKGRFLKEDLKKIKGIVFWDEGKLINNGRRELIKNIDELPYPARDLTPMEEFYLKNQLHLFGVRRMVTLMTSRGCPYRCVFCGSPVQWGAVRFHSPERVVNEIKKLVKEYQADGIMFWDDLFTAPVSRVEKMVELIKKGKLQQRLTFFGYARANLINEKMCRLLKSINVKRLIFGLESGSDKILGYLKQHSVTVADNRRAVKLCRKYGITTSSGFITGTPGETLADLRQTYEFMKKFPLDNTQIYILTPYPGTETWRRAEKENLVSKDMDFGKLFVQLAPLNLRDFFKRDKPGIIRGRIFLNSKYKNNREYLRLIFNMQKLAFWQNLAFYLRTVPQNLNMIVSFLKIKTELYFGKNND